MRMPESFGKEIPRGGFVVLGREKELVVTGFLRLPWPSSLVH